MILRADESGKCLLSFMSESVFPSAKIQAYKVIILHLVLQDLVSPIKGKNTD
jgi:hypothetical protein